MCFIFSAYARVNNVRTKTNFSSSATKVTVGLYVGIAPSKLFNDTCKSSVTIGRKIIRERI